MPVSDQRRKVIVLLASERSGANLSQKGRNIPEERTRFERVHYDSLNAPQKEPFNFQKIAATLADFGFNCIKLADDWQGADFLAYHLSGTTTLRVQLKSRLAIYKKYCGKDHLDGVPAQGRLVSYRT